MRIFCSRQGAREARAQCMRAYMSTGSRSATQPRAKKTFFQSRLFMEIPIRHDPELEQIRRECAMLTLSEISERQGIMVFSATARQKLMDFHKQINQKIQASGSNND